MPALLSTVQEPQARYRIVARYEPAKRRELQAFKSRLITRYARRVDSSEGVLRARQFANAAIAAYWDVKTAIAEFEIPLPPQSPVPRSAARPMRADAEEFGQLAAGVPQNEGMYALASTYAALLPPELRSRQGVFYTPPPLVERLCDMVTEAGFDWVRGRAIDPACGGGALIASVAARMISAMAKARRSCHEIRESLIARLRGVEIDGFSAWMSQAFIEIAALDVCRRAGERLPTLVTQADTLELSDTECEGKFDLVIGNPPYGRVSLTESARRRFVDSLYGHANLYGIFTHVATRMAANNGVIGFVTPTSFLGGQYFQNLRRLLVAAAPPCAIDFVADRTGVFEDVLQETCLATFRRGQRSTKVAVHFLKSTLEDESHSIQGAGRYPCDNTTGAPWVLPRTARQVPLIEAARKLPWRLKDYGYSVSTGPLVWNRHKSQLTDEPGEGCIPLVWAESVRSDGVFEFRCERRNHRPFVEVLPGQVHLLCTSACVLVQRTTAKEQSRRLVAAVMPAAFLRKHGAAVVENHLNMLRRDRLRTLTGPARGLSLETMAAVLNCQIVDDVFRCISGSVAVSAYELEGLPLPDPEFFVEIQRLLERGGSRHQIEERVAIAYGNSAHG